MTDRTCSKHDRPLDLCCPDCVNETELHLEARAVHLEKQLKQVEASRDQLADDFLTVHSALNLAVKALDPNGYMSEIAYRAGVEVLRVMEKNGYSLYHEPDDSWNICPQCLQAALIYQDDSDMPQGERELYCPVCKEVVGSEVDIPF